MNQIKRLQGKEADNNNVQEGFVGRGWLRRRHSAYLERTSLSLVLVYCLEKDGNLGLVKTQQNKAKKIHFLVPARSSPGTISRVQIEHNVTTRRLMNVRAIGEEGGGGSDLIEPSQLHPALGSSRELRYRHASIASEGDVERPSTNWPILRRDGGCF